ncbi:tetratricopeptide repeat protein [Acidobacteriota bacterium]
MIGKRKLILLLFTAFALAAPFALASLLSEEEKQDLFSQAKEYFREANEASSVDPLAARDLYEKALRRFERLERDGGLRNGKLYYNIGNTYFRLGDLGRAVLYYRRAEHYLSNDPNLHQNLGYARSRRQDRIEEKARTKVLKTLLFWHYDLSSKTRSVVFIIFFGGFWLGAALRIFLPRVPPRWILVLLSLVAVVFLSSLVADGWLARHNREGVILAHEVTARKGDGDSYESAFNEPLHAGTEFLMIEERTGWYQIELHDGRRCWIPQSAAGLV